MISFISLRNLNISKINWNSPLIALGGKRPSQSLLKLVDSEFKTVRDLLWILPLRVQPKPRIQSFTHIEPDKLFLGFVKTVNVRSQIAFGRRGKGKVQLFNITCVVKDMHSEQYLNLKWFNAYPNQRKQIEALEEFTFLGTPSEFKGVLQVTNPKINPKELGGNDELLIEYPTVNTVPGRQIHNIIKKIPAKLWQEDIEQFPIDFQKQFLKEPIIKSFIILHGKTREYSSELYQKAKDQIVYAEFALNHFKMLARKQKHKAVTGTPLKIDEKIKEDALNFFPYDLTKDQEETLKTITKDLSETRPMMRLIQGDVGCGKTTLALISILFTIKNGMQVAFMCPTEALALQHAETVKETFKDTIQFELLLGSTKAAQKKEIYTKLETGALKLVIGTHSLIQDAVQFHHLNLAIIDEQHKFGVDQRQRLIKKGKAVNTLIMSATPIPRTLQLAQYGDLDISTIRTMPAGRKGIKTRIVTKATYEKYLSFIKTRMSMDEQIYIIAPAIEESETLQIQNINSLIKSYKQYFPEYKIQVLHGQLKPEEKEKVLNDFTAGKIDLLISTTVIEVGINVLNSTVIAIYSPDRFGLSSIHQLRGRVGRGEKPGFCFLITDTKTSKEAVQRLKVVENTLDGFEIAEADLKNRGSGDLFGTNQSGHQSPFHLANIIEHFQIFEQVTQDIKDFQLSHTELTNLLLTELIQDPKVSSTI